jgi:hypothetical protein
MRPLMDTMTDTLFVSLQKEKDLKGPKYISIHPGMHTTLYRRRYHIIDEDSWLMRVLLKVGES